MNPNTIPSIEMSLDSMASALQRTNDKRTIQKIEAMIQFAILKELSLIRGVLASMQRNSE